MDAMDMETIDRIPPRLCLVESYRIALEGCKFHALSPRDANPFELGFDTRNTL